LKGSMRWMILSNLGTLAQENSIFSFQGLFKLRFPICRTFKGGWACGKTIKGCLNGKKKFLILKGKELCSQGKLNSTVCTQEMQEMFKRVILSSKRLLTPNL
jgi:hypothetical protein